MALSKFCVRNIWLLGLVFALGAGSGSAPSTRPAPALTDAVAALHAARKAQSAAMDAAPARVERLGKVMEARSAIAGAEAALARANAGGTRQQKAEARDALAKAKQNVADAIAEGLERDPQILATISVVKKAELNLEALRWVDLLDLVDPREHALKGEWAFEGNTLVANRRQLVDRAVLRIPVKVPDSYKLHLQFSRASGPVGPFIIFPVGNALAALEFDNHMPRCSGIARINDLSPNHNATQVPGISLHANAMCDVVLEVQRDEAQFSITVELNQNGFLKWSGTESMLSPPENFELLEPHSFALAAWSNRVAFKTVRLITDPRSDPAPEANDSTTQISAVQPHKTPKVVFVIDTSGSMLSKIPQVKEDLTAALNGFAPEQYFSIVAVGNEVTKFAPALVKASPQNITKAREFLDRLSPIGAGDFYPGIAAALSLTPDTIWVATDGTFTQPAKELSEIQNLNRGRRVRINTTLKFANEMDNKAIECLKQLARDNGGICNAPDGTPVPTPNSSPTPSPEKQMPLRSTVFQE